MSTLIQSFNPMQFDPTQSVGSLPIGKHPVVIESDEVKANKNNDGGYLQFNLRIIDGPQAGATGAYRLNLYHSNVQTVEIAHKQLSAICHVVKVFQLGSNGTETSVLHNIPFFVEVGPQKNDPAYTEIKKVFDINGNEPKKGANTQPQQQQPQQQQPQPQQPQNNSWGNQQQPQQQQPQQNNSNAAWNQQPQQQPQQPQQQGNTGWGNQPQQQQAQQPGNNANWQQQQGQGNAGKPPWATN